MPSIHLDPEDFRPVIDTVMDAAIRRLVAEGLMTDKAGKVLWTKRQTADEMSISEATVDRLRKQGLPAVKLDGLVLFNPDSVRAWVRSKEGGAA